MTLTVPTPPEHRVVARRLTLAWLLSGGCVAVVIGLTMIFILTFAQNVPLNDQSFTSVHIAFNTHDEILTFTDIAGKYGSSRAIWTNLITYANTALTAWDISLETWTTPIIAGLIFLTLVRLAWLDLSHRSAIAFVVIGMLVFALNHQLSWIWAVHNSSFFFVMFFLLAVYVLRVLPRGWQAVLLAALFCFASTFSLQQGIMSWPVMLLVLIGRGYRSRWTYLFWIVAGAFFIWLLRLDVAVIGSSPDLILMPTDPFQWLIFILAGCGAPLASSDINLAAVAGSVGLVFFGTNIVYLGLVCRRWLLVATWGALGVFAIGLVFLMSLGRLESLGLNRALSTWYYIHTIPLWVAVAVMSLESLHLMRAHLTDRTTPRRRQRLHVMQAGSVILLGAFAILYINANLSIVQATERFFEKPYGSFSVGKDEECLTRFPLTANLDCRRLMDVRIPGSLIYRQLAVYGHPTSLHLLPAAYVPGDTIVFDSIERGMHRIIDSMWFPAVKEHVFHMLPPNLIYEPEFVNRITVSDVPAVVTNAPAERVWYILANGNTDLSGFARAIFSSYRLHAWHQDGRLIIAEFVRRPIKS